MSATYERRNWIDEAVQYPDRYSMQTLTGGMVTLTPSPGIVDTVGTPQSAVNFNHIERGILDENIAVSLLLQHIRLLEDTISNQTDETTPEVGTVTIKNTNKFPFSSPISTVALTKKRGTLNYSVDIISAEASDNKPIGDIVVCNRQLNGFGMKYSGSASSVTIKYRVTGGITV